MKLLTPFPDSYVAIEQELIANSHAKMSMHYDLNNTSMELPTHTDVSTFDGDTSAGTTGTTGTASNAPKWDGQQLKDAVTNSEV